MGKKIGKKLAVGASIATIISLFVGLASFNSNTEREDGNDLQVSQMSGNIYQGTIFINESEKSENDSVTTPSTIQKYPDTNEITTEENVDISQNKESDQTDVPNDDTNSELLKLTFFNGSFSFYSPENDVGTPQRYDYLQDRISPIVYITITDSNGIEVVSDKSEYVSEYVIPLTCGDYILTALCDGYIEYSKEISLNYENKIFDTWKHDIYFIPESHIAKNLRFQVLYSDGRTASNIILHIGYPGHTLRQETDNEGFLHSRFALSEGEYNIYYDEKNLSASFYIDRQTNDGQLLTVTLKPIN